MKTHELKCWPEFFEKILSGEKNFELRKNDRDFKIGDTLVLHEYEWHPEECDGEYLGRKVIKSVNYILYGPCFGLAEGYCIMNLT